MRRAYCLFNRNQPPIYTAKRPGSQATTPKNGLPYEKLSGQGVYTVPGQFVIRAGQKFDLRFADLKFAGLGV
jgi:hypothetical protein